MQKKVYILEGLDCANCAARIEDRLQKMEGLEDVSVTYATKQLRFAAEDPESMLPKIIEIIDAIEPDVEVVERGRRSNTTAAHSHDHSHHNHEHHHDHDHDHDHHHDHEDTCSHEHHHNHGDACGCGHDHNHDHDHEHEHNHDHDHEYHHEHEHDEDMEKRVYILEGLDCANCAAKIEAKIRSMPEVGFASVAYATKQLRVSANNQDELMPKMQAVIDSIEDGVTLVPKDTRPASEEKTEKKESIMDNPLFSIFAGAVIFIIGEILIHTVIPEHSIASFAIFIAAYLILGGKVLMAAFKNIQKGQVFDENFLMCIATIGAFCIQEFPEAVGVMLFYRIGEYFEDRATEQSRSQIMEAVDLRPEVVNLVIGDDIRVIDAEEANVGDILLVRPGDRIPLDGVVIDGESRIDTSPVTGEPVPVMARVGDNVVSGCVNTSGQLKMRVEKVLEESMVTRILDSVENAAASKPEIDKFITKFARVYTPFVVFLALFVALVLPLVIPGWHYLVDPAYRGAESVIWGREGTASIYTALTFLVISCPCALVLSVPLAFFSGIGAASKKGILFKGGIAIEGLKGTRAVVMDKTGTITKGNFVVQKAESLDPSITEDQLLAISASCELSSTHPIGSSIVTAAEERGLEIERLSSVEEIAGEGIKAVLTKGTALVGNRKLMESFGIDLGDYQKEDFGTEVLVALDDRFIGHIVISDTIKEDAAAAIASVKNLGIKTVMLTGDAEDSARAVADQTGVDEMYARLLPEDKLTRLQKIREKDGAVMFIGDGINDAPVLAGADVGAAMGSGADAAIEAADVVFMNSEMNAIPEALSIARMTNRISWQNVYFALAVKIIVMIMGLFGFANMWLAVFADTGVSVLCLMNSIRILRRK